MDMTPRDVLTEKVIGLAIEVHRELGPGLLESVYEECLAYEMARQGVGFARQAKIALSYKSTWMECAFKADFIVEDKLIIELKAVEKVLPIHAAQVITYLRLTRLKTGLLMNFNTKVLKDGIRRMAV
jgi:GxxExxY protein